MKKLLSLMALSVVFGSLFGQQVKVYGTVKDERSSGLGGVSVVASGTAFSTVSDSTGYYELSLDSGSYTIQFSRAGFASREMPVELNSDKQLDVLLNLPAEPGVAEPEVKTMEQKKEGTRIYGTVTDEKDKSPMVGVSVVERGTTNGTQTDMDGKYELFLAPGVRNIEFTYIGYGKRSFSLPIIEGRHKRHDVMMGEEAQEMDIVVVTGSKYEKKLSEEVVSMEVLKANVINQNNARMDEAVNKVPGVNMLGKTISIRGGSGFSDATSNRVLALLDEMPIISPENGSIRWETVPIEMLEQVEIIKGSSSALYGSSALNGVLNMRTINPKPEMVNKLLVYYGFYGEPRQRTWNHWWNRKFIRRNGDTVSRVQRPMFGGGQFMHAKQYGDFGIVLGASYNQDQGFRQNNDYKRARFSAKLRYTPHKRSNLTIGLNMNFFHENLKDFFAGIGIAKLMYVPAEVAITRTRTFNIDPYINYYDKKENRHSLKFRVYNTMFNSTTGDTTQSTQFYVDYSFLRNFRKINLVITTGVNGFITAIQGKTYGNINSAYPSTRRVSNAAVYLQAEKKFWKRLTLSGGVRLEYAMLDTALIYYPFHLLSKAMGRDSTNLVKSPVAPLFRFGFNVQASEGTFIRGSIGQGFRYPAMAEKFVRTRRSGADVYPNDKLLPESGWSAEVGIKQGVKISKWVAYFDAAGYITQYRDMIEFQLYDSVPVNDPNIGIPFQAVNVTHARVMGVELSAVANGKIFGVPLNFLVGYSYLYPENLDHNPEDPNSVKILKYRIQHSAKADIQTNFKGVTVGISAFFNSFMKNIDKSGVGALKVVNDFRKTHNKGDFVMDVRAGYSYKEKATFMFICKNILNTEYTLRPGLIEAPRNFTFQLGYNF